MSLSHLTIDSNPPVVFHIVGVKRQKSLGFIIPLVSFQPNKSIMVRLVWIGTEWTQADWFFFLTLCVSSLSSVSYDLVTGYPCSVLSQTSHAEWSVTQHDISLLHSSHSTIWLYPCLQLTRSYERQNDSTSIWQQTYYSFSSKGTMWSEPSQFDTWQYTL